MVLIPRLTSQATRFRPQKFFFCRECLRTRRSAEKLLSRRHSSLQPNSRNQQSLRSQSTAASDVPNARISNVLGKGSPLAALSKRIAGETLPSKRFFPESNSKSAAYWLLGSATSVFGLVVFGGLTRLTESGLSITEWRPVTGSLPPRSDLDWADEFAKYQSSPEFKLLNPHMTLDEFKQIYFMEWTHRVWGRVVGITFVLPALYFIARRRITASMAANVSGIGVLIGFQGVLGWWMVKSGLKDDLFAPGSHPRVSQYRLTAHLGTAFTCYLAMVWNGMSILRENRYLKDPAAALGEIQKFRSPALAPLRRSLGGLAGLVFLTAMSGGLVAGLDAGLIYNDFPWMGLGLTPPKSELFSSFYSRREDGSDIWWRNMLENPSMVQLDHRALATTTFSAVLAFWTYVRFRKAGAIKKACPPRLVRDVSNMARLVWLQATLGISTLIYLVPIPLAAAHQAGALALLTGVLVAGHRVRVPPRLIHLLKRELDKAKASSHRIH